MVSLDKPPHRNRSQVLNIIKDRMETARRNSETIQKQIERSEAQQSKISHTANQDLMEVTEELDEDDNIVSSKVENFDKAVEEMADVLKKQTITTSKVSNTATSKSSIIVEHPTSSTKPLAPAESGNLDEPATSLSLGKPVVLPSITKRIEELSDDDESIDDAAPSTGVIRQNLNDLGPVVAELDLEEEEDEEEWSEDDDDDAFEENEYGMNNIRDQMEEEYIREMEALAKKHGMKNIGPNPTVLQEYVPKSVLSKPKSGTLTTTENQIPIPSLTRDEDSKPKKAKGVRFAENLDISPQPTNTTVRSSSTIEKDAPFKDIPAPLGDVVEKPFVTTSSIPAIENPTKRVSRFKSAKMATTGASTASPGVKGGRNLPHGNASPNPIKTDKNVGDGDASMKEEFGLYSKRIETPEHQIDKSIFQIPSGDDDDDSAVYESSKKVSRFKAARLGLLNDE
jgi:unconventional prefoldin RPB5 interactor 1